MIRQKWFLIITITICQLTFNEAFAQNSEKLKYCPPVRSEFKLTDNLILHQNIRYGAIPDSVDSSNSDRILDLYLPENSQTQQASLPVFVFIHGGGFTGGDKDVRALCSNMALQGFAVVSINYRLTLKYNKVSGASCSANMSKGLPVNGKFHPMLQKAVKNASEDAEMALGWIKSNAEKYRLDLSKLVVSGGSAGAMTALHLAYVSNPKFVSIKAVIDFWGGLENAAIIRKGAAPILIYHGDQDSTINIAYAYALKHRMDVIGSQKSQLRILKDKGHAQYNLIAKEKIAEIVSFLKTVL